MIVKPFQERRNRAYWFPSQLHLADHSCIWLTEKLWHTNLSSTARKSQSKRAVSQSSKLVEWIRSKTCTISHGNRLKKIKSPLFLPASFFLFELVGSPIQHTGPPFRLLPSISLSLLPLYLSFSLSPLLGSPQLRGPGAFRPDTHTRTHTRACWHTHTLTPANGRSRKCLIPVLEWCHYASLTGRLQDLSQEKATETERESKPDWVSSILHKTRKPKEWNNRFISKCYVLILGRDSRKDFALLYQTASPHGGSFPTLASLPTEPNIHPVTPLSRDPKVKGTSVWLCLCVGQRTHVWLYVWVDAHVFL